MSSEEAGPADIERPELELVVELGEERLEWTQSALAVLSLELESFTRLLSRGVTSLSLRVFSASLMMVTTSLWLDHFTSLSPMATR